MPDILTTLSTHDCILSAPPGAGKSTFLPLQLLSLDVFKNQQILLLQPRQVAVRSIAHYLAQQINEAIGHTIGYQMRGESSVSKKTRLCVITEGLLIAKLQQDPELSNVGLIIFDEFHERSVQSDIALALSIEVQSALREDLRILVMSATLNINDISRLLPQAKLIQSAGRSFPIEYVYKPLAARERLENAVLQTIKDALIAHEGNMLVFLPGANSIRKVASLLQQANLPNVLVAPLYGALGSKLQQQAIQLPQQGKRKIVLATNIAETSLTIDGVNIVIDSGREKVQRLHISRKTNQLSEQMISKASSMQRAGRAGRQQAGICYRLWSEQRQQVLPESTAAQITQVDISATLLTLLEWGTDFNQLALLDKPSQAQIEYAYGLLQKLLLVDEKRNLTGLGKLAAVHNAHPRLAVLLAYAQHSAVTPLQCLLTATLVAILEGRSLEQAVNTNDVAKQCEYVLKAVLDNSKNISLSHSKSPIKDILKEVQRNARKILGERITSSQLKELSQQDNIETEIGQILLHAFPDKIGMKRSNDSYSLTDGTGAEFAYYEQDVIHRPTWIVCVDTQITQSANSIIRRYSELPHNIIAPYLDKYTKIYQQQAWDNKLAKVLSKQMNNLGEIVISSQPSSLHVNEQTVAILMQEIKRKGLASLLVTANVLLGRIMLARAIDTQSKQNFPDMSVAKLTETLEDWLPPYLIGLSSWQQLRALNWQQIIQSMLSWQQRLYLDEYFPTQYLAPTGNKHRLDYNEPEKVTLAIRLQELYGLSQTPSVGENKWPITLSLLSPAHREIQKTSDLAGFWQGSYKEVQKDMKGQYPKHYWPDDPANALPTTKTKRKM